jgi:uncharacterized phage-like protein YoqJ
MRYPIMKFATINKYETTSRFWKNYEKYFYERLVQRRIVEKKKSAKQIQIRKKFKDSSNYHIVTVTIVTICDSIF